MVNNTPAPTHIRPRKRTASKPKQKAESASNPLATQPSPPAVEETRQRIETWVGLNSNLAGKNDKKTIDDALNNKEQSLDKTRTSKDESVAHKSILKQTKKYSGQVTSSPDGGLAGGPPEINCDGLSPVVVRDIVVERPRRKGKPAKQAAVAPSKMRPRSADSSNAVEGYTPKTTSAAARRTSHDTASGAKVRFQNQPGEPNSESQQDSATVKQGPPSLSGDDEGEEAKTNNEPSDQPLVFSSISDLMEAAGTLPKQGPGQKTPLVYEAGLEFSCMTADEYKEMQQEAVQEQYDSFMGTSQLPDCSSDDDDDHDDEIWDLLGDPANDGDLSDEDEDPAPSEFRAFLKLWDAISQWVTPEAVLLVRNLHSKEEEQQDSSYDPGFVPQVDRSDVGASRCAGLMAMLQMHTSKCLVDDLKRAPDDLRSAERLLASLVRCFNYDRPMPKFDSALARALTCVLLATVLNDTEVALPESCKLLDMNPDEYRYLSRSAIVNFGNS